MSLRASLDLHSAKPRRMARHTIPEWDNAIVGIMALNARERDKFEAERFEDRGASDEVNLENFRAALCVRVLCDPETQERLYEDDDAALLGEWPASVIEPIFAEAQRLSGMRKEDVDFFAKRSAATHPRDSSTNSHVASASP